MIFPIAELLDEQQSIEWVERYFHPKRLRCPGCGAITKSARESRTRQRGLVDYRCRRCQSTDISGTVFAGSNLEPRRVVLLLRGACKGEPAALLAEELALSRQCVHRWRQRIQENAYALLSDAALADAETETDEMFQNAGKKGEKHVDPDDPPRRRANKRRGHGTYANDRPPVVGTVGRRSAQCRLRVCEQTDGVTLRHPLHGYTLPRATCYTDEWRGYSRVERTRCTVCHGRGEWARDEDGDGVREVHTNTIEGLWTTARNFLRPFRRVHKKHLKYYLAMCEHHINLKRVTPQFIAQFVAERQSVT
jgi:transposase